MKIISGKIPVAKAVVVIGTLIASIASASEDCSLSSIESLLEDDFQAQILLQKILEPSNLEKSLILEESDLKRELLSTEGVKK